MQSSQLPLVSRFEHDLLTLLLGFLGHMPRSQWLGLLTRPCERPKCLSRTAVELIQNTLAKGVTLHLARAGWRQERFLRGGQATKGRLWQRTTPAELGLVFSKESLDFLIWVTAAAADRPNESWLPHRNLTLGDRWLLFVAYQAVERSDIGVLWSQREPWRSDPLTQLQYAADFEHPADSEPLDFQPLLTPAGVALLESSQRTLADRWVAMERAKAQVTSAQKLRAIGESQARVLEAFLSAIDQAGRRDLARFLLVALGRLLREEVTPRGWIPQVELGQLRLADRQQAYRDALLVVSQAERLDYWQRQARGVGYFDDDYQAAQLWKSDWEAYNGERTVTASRGLLDQANWL